MYKDEIEQIRINMSEVGRSSWNIEEIDNVFILALQHAKERPQLTPVDLSVLIESGIDCEFSRGCGFSERTPVIGQLLSSVNDAVYNKVYKNGTGRYFNECRPRMNHVHAWQGGKSCPLPEGLRVKIYFRNITPITSLDYSTLIGWSFDGGNWEGRDDAIIAFEVMGLDIRYRLPWGSHND